MRITPQEAGYLANGLNNQFAGAPFIVGPVMATKDNPFDMRIAPDENPVYVIILDGTEHARVSIMAVPAGAVMRLVRPGPAELARYWLALLEELRRLGCIIETPRDDGAAPSTGQASDAASDAARDDGAGLDKLTQERLEYLRKDDNFRNMTDQELGNAMDLDPDTVKKFRLRHGLLKRKQRKGIPKQSP